MGFKVQVTGIKILSLVRWLGNFDFALWVCYVMALVFPLDTFLAFRTFNAYVCSPLLV